MAAQHQVRIEVSGETFPCNEDRSVLSSMETQGRRAIPVGCRGGGCGACRVQILSGTFEVRRMSRACVSEHDQAQGIVLACQLYPRSDLNLQVLGRSRKT
ncbi:2Fe-2S iron-sulfur cluster binding domain-containing protein [Castellaniella defragrans]|uniref:2Fe-2S iron-sulfur cluster binding domain-containing protein n=1 Tax=Castellaniella defragrans TaxID=75697 RepID=UPI002AFE5474|nr:2Fe-2S iron-sulfur cluster binding domain-containing protein [Castellaniella defragrans]